jgi:hypothetical protein
MSSTLFYKPVVKNAKSLPDSIKFILKKYFSDFDNWDGDCRTISFETMDKGYFRGVKDNSSEEVAKDIEQFLSILEKHGEIQVYLEH